MEATEPLARIALLGPSPPRARAEHGHLVAEILQRASQQLHLTLHPARARQIVGADLQNPHGAPTARLCH